MKHIGSYSKTENTIPQKILIVKISAKKVHGYYENLKQNIWTEFLPVPMFSWLKNFQTLFKVVSKLTN